MLGYVVAEGHGAADRLMAEVARRLAAEGHRLAGAVQVNADRGPDLPCHMDLEVLEGGVRVRISQDLGALSGGCRLDPAGLARAVGLVEAALRADPAPRLLIVNKFGLQEAEGGGFRPAIGTALAGGIAVLTAVGAGHRAAFEDFAGGMAEAVAASPGAALDWCRTHLA